MTDIPQKKSLRDYLPGAKKKVSKKFRVSYTYMDLKTHQDVHALDKSSAIQAAKKELLDPTYMRNVHAQEINEAWDQHWNQNSRNIIDSTIKLIAAQNTAAQRRNAVKKMADDHKVNYIDLYNAIVSKTGTQFFSENKKK